jgi:DNA-binding transcriptional LysR family regulator
VDSIILELANLDMDVLRTLAVAMDLGGFAKAADRLGRSQSAVSLQMRKLEDRVGRPLFRRRGRGVALTDAGDVVLDYARRILELNDRAVAAARGIAIEGSVRFGVPQDFGDTWLPAVLGRFARAHPSVLLEARVDRTNKLVEHIAQGNLDLALLWGSHSSLPSAVPVARLPMAWIGPKGYVRRRREEIPLALFEAPCVFRQPGIEALEKAKQPWRLAFTSPSLSGLWAAAAAGLGVTIRTALALPSSLAALERASGLPKLPQIGLSLYAADANPGQATVRLREILLDELAGAIGGLR